MVLFRGAENQLECLPDVPSTLVFVRFWTNQAFDNACANPQIDEKSGTPKKVKMFGG